jgi:hypothetical protein
MSSQPSLEAVVVWEKSPPPDWGEYWTTLGNGTVVKQRWAWEGWTDTRSDEKTMWARTEFRLKDGEK